MSRLDQIREKLNYADNQKQNLMKTLTQAKREGIDPIFLSHTAADIISTSRECYDYCAQDILTDVIVPNTENQSLIDRFNNNSLHFNFPFHENQLTNNRNPISELQSIAPDFYNYLIDLAQNIEQNKPIPNTLLMFGDILLLRDMVNEKKHDSLIEIEKNDDQEILIESGFTMIIPLKEQSGFNKIQVSPGSKISRVAEFRFETIDREVANFCNFATVSTRIILEDIYSKYL